MEIKQFINLLITAIMLLYLASLLNGILRRTYVYLRRKKFRVDKQAIILISLSTFGFALFLFLLNNWITPI